MDLAVFVRASHVTVAPSLSNTERKATCSRPFRIRGATSNSTTRPFSTTVWPWTFAATLDDAICGTGGALPMGPLATPPRTGAAADPGRVAAITVSAAVRVGAGTGPRAEIIGDTAASALLAGPVPIPTPAAPLAATRTGGAAGAFAVFVTGEDGGFAATCVVGCFLTCVGEVEPFFTWIFVADDEPTNP